MTFFIGEQIQIERKTYTGATDDFQEPIYTKQIVNIDDVLVAWNSTGMIKNLEGVIFNQDATLYFPSGTVILEDDVFIVRGERYIKAGQTVKWEPVVAGSILTETIRFEVPIKHYKGNVNG